MSRDLTPFAIWTDSVQRAGGQNDILYKSAFLEDSACEDLASFGDGQTRGPQRDRGHRGSCCVKWQLKKKTPT